jgi:diacylglycerol kinase family enzyme
MGTGNDFIRFFGEDKALFKDVKNLVDGVVHPVDLMEVNGRCGINISSVGLDCQTAAEVHKYTSLPGVGKKFGYILSLGANFIKGIIYNFRVTAGDYHRDGDMVLACVCNGNYYGGGFHPVPEAEIDDGLLDVLVVKKISRLRFLTAVKRYADGKYSQLPDLVDHVRCTEVTITSPDTFTINIDGEMIQDTKMELRLIPGGINFIFPKEVIDNGKIVRKTK